jgi:uncharacterized membrane protein
MQITQRWSIPGLLVSFMFCSSIFAQGTPVTPEPIAKPSYADIEAIVAENCSACHSADVALGGVVLDTEEQLKALSAEAAEALKSGLMPAGDETFKDTADGQLLIQYLESLQTPALVYADIAPILQSNCLSCHSGSSARRGVRFDTEALAIQSATRAVSVLVRGTMPPRRPTFKDSPDGKTLLSWFQNPLASPKP